MHKIGTNQSVGSSRSTLKINTKKKRRHGKLLKRQELDVKLQMDQTLKQQELDAKFQMQEKKRQERLQLEEKERQERLTFEKFDATKNIRLVSKFQETEVDNTFCTLRKLLKV